jgi:hypothetical protein
MTIKKQKRVKGKNKSIVKWKQSMGFLFTPNPHSEKYARARTA